MTPQEIYDQVIFHLRKQGCKAIGKYGGCKYRTESNLRCAIGILIKDEEYSPQMEGHGFFDLIALHMDCVPDTLKERLTPHKYLLNALMRTHDFIAVELWEADFQGIAKEFLLVYTPSEKKES